MTSYKENGMNYNKQYKELIKTVLEKGSLVKGRNGYTLSIPFATITIKDLANDHKLLLRKQYVKGIIGEFKTLISNEQLVNCSQFKKNGCNYWCDNAGPNGELRLDYYDELHKQLPTLIKNIKQDPNSRRHKLDLWNADNVQFTNACRAGRSNYSGNITEHKMYKRWSEELDRCRNPNHSDYKNYGGRGISVSEEFHDFKMWLGHIEMLPNYGEKGYTLDRQDNNKNYERENLIWSSISDQNTNQRMKGNNTSGFTGVTKSGNKWQARVMVDYKRKSLGRFATKEEAAKVRDDYIIAHDLNHRLSCLTTVSRKIMKPLSLECCWTGFTLSIINSKIHMTFYTRSQDLILGTQADIFLAWLFMEYISKETGYKTGDLMYVMSNVHIYKSHFEGAKELLTRTEEDWNNPIKFQLEA